MMISRLFLVKGIECFFYGQPHYLDAAGVVRAQTFGSQEAQVVFAWKWVLHVVGHGVESHDGGSHGVGTNAVSPGQQYLRLLERDPFIPVAFAAADGADAVNDRQVDGPCAVDVCRDAGDSVFPMGFQAVVEFLGHAGGRLGLARVEHLGSVRQCVFVGSVVAVERTGRDAEHVLDRHGYACAGVLLQLRKRNEYVVFFEALVQVESGVHEAAPGHFEPAIAAKLSFVARVFESHLVAARRLDGRHVPAEVDHDFFEGIAPVEILDNHDAPGARVVQDSAQRAHCVWMGLVGLVGGHAREAFPLHAGEVDLYDDSFVAHKPLDAPDQVQGGLHFLPHQFRLERLTSLDGHRRARRLVRKICRWPHVFFRGNAKGARQSASRQ